jgi:formamidopyrimidine-DNA glycosylase
LPELPEVETVRRGIEPHVVGRTIEEVRVHDRRLRWPVPRDLAAKLRGQKIHSVTRRAKYLLLNLDRDRLLLHLGMSGRILVLAGDAPRKKHDHLDLILSGPMMLRLHDPRRFGAALLWPLGQAHHKLLRGLGPEPFSEEFSGDYLFEKSRGRSAPVKNFLMDGRIVVGVGNIYASESLFRAGIRPNRPAGKVTRVQYRRLADAVREVLNRAIVDGGTTLKDFSFTNAHGEFGDFQVRLNVYDRAGQPCPKCRAPIRRSVIGQRSSYYCPNCQR